MTGGTGSMGKTFVRRVLTGELGTPKKLIAFSRDESKQHDMRVDYLHRRKAATDDIEYRNFMNVLEFRIGDVRSYSDLVSAMRDVDIVVHAAALKQVPTCEYFPGQAVMTNCLGAMNIVQAIGDHQLPIETVMAISTDKACKPVNVMGMTKALQERVITCANILNRSTRYICVRYGNVLASRGSVIPLFHEQIRNGGPLTITHGNMTRFLLTLNQAVDTVFDALRHALPGEIYVPTVPGARITDIAKALIGERKIEIVETGVRPGEKFDEILVSEEEVNHTIRRGDYYVVRPALPELSNGVALVPALEKEFSSGDFVLDYAQTVDLLKTNDLMLESGGSRAGELLR
ncbi:MAG TPA: polysaccharide biosynthesis protein [Burkholderiales bacterium]|nr:polysaccharide biosynthesis protein [Burkholderiales bacterium]